MLTQKEMKRVTVKDLAESLGVGHTTVRKALNDLPGISDKTRERVKREAERVGYYPNLLARSLKQQKSSLIGLVVTKSLRSIWYASLVDTLIAVLDARGYGVILSRTDRNAPEKVKKSIEELLGGHVAGVVAGPLLQKEDIDPFKIVTKNKLPLVVFDAIENVSSGVSIDHQKGLKQVISHFVEFGHRRIGYLCCDSSFSLPNTRRYGFEQALFDYDLPVIGRDIVSGENSFEGGRRAVAELLADRADDLPTAFFCHSDVCALGAMKAFQNAGVRVPDDISLVGYDDLPEAGYSTPGLTSVGGVIDKMARKIADIICADIDGKVESPHTELIEPALVIRDSVGPRKDA